MGPVVCMIWEGLDIVKTGRKMLGATKPLNSEPGTIRGDYSIETGRNIVHGSDSVESAEEKLNYGSNQKEIQIIKEKLINGFMKNQCLKIKYDLVYMIFN